MCIGLQARNVLQTTVTLPSDESKVFAFREGILVKESAE
jgi:hypothetical protein